MAEGDARQLIACGIGARVEQYIDGVLDGSLVVSARVRQAVQRHVNDLARQSTPEFPYHFDSRHATNVCQFFPLMLRHSIGEFAGRPFELESWQAFCIWSIFGWKRDDDNSRRFRKVYWSMGRKNGKSSIAAGVCLYMAVGDVDPATSKPEAVGQILVTATKKDQAKVVYGEAERMRMQSPVLKKMSGVKYETITFPHNQSYIRTVSNDRPFDGLNPHLVVMDELHAWREHNRDFYNTMVTGGGSRTQPIHLIITTAGADDSHLWIENYSYACEVLGGNFKDESLFAFVCELDPDDDPGNEEVWVKANPNLGVSISLDYLRERWNEDKNTSVGRSRFNRYHCNRQSSSTESAFDLQSYDKCVGALGDWKEADAIAAGVDLGSRDDLSAYAICARFPVGEQDGVPVYRYEFRVRAFISENTKRDLALMPFSEWIFQGDLFKSRYPTEELQSCLIDELTLHEGRLIAIDPHNGMQLGERLEREGFTPAAMRQTHSNYHEPITEFISLMEKGLLRFDDSKLLRWCASNAIINKDRQDRWMFDKRSSVEKIDPIVACVMAFWVCSRQPARSLGNLFLS